MSVIKSENIRYENIPFNAFRAYWLELALTNYKNKCGDIDPIYGNVTIGEFIRTYAKEELENCVVVKD
jgi:hypothetical protein